MEIQIMPDAQAFLARKFPNATTLLLASNDGSNRFTSARGCCIIGDRFMIVVTDIVPPEFSVRLDNPLFEVYTTTYEPIFLTETPILTVNQGNGGLMLKSAGGIIDLNVEIKAEEA